MKRAAIGIRMHSGWGVVVAVTRDTNGIHVLDRRRIVVAESASRRSVQPYHHAAPLSLVAAGKHIATCAAASARLASAEIKRLVHELKAREYRIIGSAVLTASGRTLPPLKDILRSHALIHTAEGEFFRDAVRSACVRSRISVTTMKERELDEQAKMKFARAATRMKARIAKFGKSLGPPWTADHKGAALAATILLGGR